MTSNFLMRRGGPFWCHVTPKWSCMCRTNLKTILHGHVTYIWLKGRRGDSSMLVLWEWGKEEHEKQREKRLDSEEIV
jgi:hypothetical protein